MPDAVFEHPRLIGIYDALDPDRSDLAHRVVTLDGAGVVETWTEVTDVTGPLVTLVSTWVFASDGAVLTSTSTLRFRELAEVEADLAAHGYVVVDVRDGRDPCGREVVVIAGRGPSARRSP